MAKCALVIANSQYDDGFFTALPAAEADAAALAGVLADPAIGEFTVKQVVNADQRAAMRAIHAFFADAQRDDLLVLHLSLHGWKDLRNRLYFVARDTERDVLEATAISADFVSERMSWSKSGRIVLLLDCCYSGAFAAGMLRRSGEAPQVNVTEPFAGKGRIVVTASTSLQFAHEGQPDVRLSRDQAQPSLFTAAVVQGLRDGSADLDRDGLISVNELYDYVYEQVRLKIPGQTPTLSVDSVQGTIYLARNPAYGSPILKDDLDVDDDLHTITSSPVATRLRACSSQPHRLLDQALRIVASIQADVDVLLGVRDPAALPGGALPDIGTADALLSEARRCVRAVTQAFVNALAAKRTARADAGSEGADLALRRATLQVAEEKEQVAESARQAELAARRAARKALEREARDAEQAELDLGMLAWEVGRTGLAFEERRREAERAANEQAVMEAAQAAETAALAAEEAAREAREAARAAERVGMGKGIEALTKHLDQELRRLVSLLGMLHGEADAAVAQVTAGRPAVGQSRSHASLARARRAAYARLIIELAELRTALAKLRAALTDFSGTDLSQVRLWDVDLDGVRWTRGSTDAPGTRWPPAYQDYVDQLSVELGEGVLEIRKSTAVTAGG